MTIDTLRELKVEDVVELDYPILKENEPISRAFSLMVEQKMFEIPVVDERKIFLGIMNYESIIRRRKIPMTSRVGHFLLAPPKLSMKDNLPEVSEIFLSTDFQILPVVRSRKLVGVVNRDTLLSKSQSAKVVSDVPLSEIMSTSIMSVKASDRISVARGKMLSLDIKELPVVDDQGKLIGIFAMENLMEFLRIPRKRAARGKFFTEKTTFDPLVKAVMHSRIFSLTSYDPVSKAVEFMLEHKTASVFVCDDAGKPVGVVHPSDILELVARHTEREGVHIQISGLEHEDPTVYDTLYEIIKKHMEKMNRIHKVELLNIHIINNAHHRNDEIFDVRMRLSTQKETLATTYESWNLYEAVDKCLSHMVKEVIKKKDKKMSILKNNHL